MVVIVGLIIVAGTALVAVAATSRSGISPLSEQTAFAEALGTPLPPLTSPDPAIGSVAPIISAQTSEGDRIQIGDDGTARLYGFFAHWCPHCQDEMPAVAEWLSTNDLPDGVEIVAISTGVDRGAPNYPPSDWFEREEWPATVLLDSEDQALSQAFGLTAFPYWVAVDANGTVVQRVSGSIPTTALTALVGQLATEQ